MAAYLGADPSIMPLAWLTASNIRSAQSFVFHGATYMKVAQSANGFRFVYQFNTTTAANPSQPWLAFACTYGPGGSSNPCFFQWAPDINNDGVVNILDTAACAFRLLSRPGGLTWNVNCDLNNDGIVNIFDITYAALF